MQFPARGCRTSARKGFVDPTVVDHRATGLLRRGLTRLRLGERHVYTVVVGGSSPSSPICKGLIDKELRLVFGETFWGPDCETRKVRPFVQIASLFMLAGSPSAPHLFANFRCPNLPQGSRLTACNSPSAPS